MKWVRERDLLIAQTLAFVQSVSGKKPDVEALPGTEALPKPEVPPAVSIGIGRKLEASVQKTIAVEPPGDERILELPRMVALPTVDLRQEIQSRVALFRAHQHRFHKERDQYFVATMAQLRAPKKDHTRPSA